jgi:hypothetical protein
MSGVRPKKLREIIEQKISKNGNPLLASPFAKRMVIKAAAAREAVARQMVCSLVAQPDPSIINMITNLLSYLKLSFLSGSQLLTQKGIAELIEFRNEIPTEIPSLSLPNGVVLLNSCHGGLLVIKTQNPDYRSDNPNVLQFIYKYKTFQALSDGINRVIKSVPACCSYILPNVRQQYLDTVVKIIKKALPGNTNKIINSIINQLKKLSFDVSPGKNQTPVAKRTLSGSEEINKNVERTFKYVKTDKGDPIINKLFSTDQYEDGDETKIIHKLAPRGMLFCNDVTITVNNRWFIGIDDGNWSGEVNPLANLATINSYITRYKYNIGTYTQISSSQGTIYYPARTNLLSCPYFMFFASRKLGKFMLS